MVGQEILCAAYFNKDGEIRPLKWQGEFMSETISIKVNRLLKVDKLQVSPRDYNLLFTCESVINNMKKRYVLQYSTSSCKWSIYRMM